MKTLLAAAILTFTAISGSSAQAAQYQIYVTNSTHVSPTQVELGSLVQKDILVDTSAKTVELHLSPVCASLARCPEFIRNVTLPLTNVKVANGSLTSVIAQGTFALNGKPTTATVQITLNADNAMDITITNSSDCKSTHSDFLGSPATRAESLL